MDYLLKTEPSTYSYADLQREKYNDLGRSFESRRVEEPAGNEAGRTAGDLSHRR